MVSGLSSPRELRERENLLMHKRFNFRNLLGEDWPLEEIDLLIESGVDYHDLEKMLKNGCPKELAVKILL